VIDTNVDQTGSDFDPYAFANSAGAKNATNDLYSRLTGFDPTAFANSKEAQNATDELAKRLGSTSNTDGIGAKIGNAVTTGVDKLTTGFKNVVKDVEKHPIRTGIDAFGQFVFGTPYIGRMGEKLLNSFAGEFDSNKFANSSAAQDATDSIADILA